MRETVHQQLSSWHESFQQYHAALAQVPDLKAHLQHIESSTTEELRQVKAVLEKQAQRGQNRLAERTAGRTASLACLALHPAGKPRSQDKPSKRYLQSHSTSPNSREV